MPQILSARPSKPSGEKRTIKVQLNLVTPIWTGNATTKTQYVEGTGLMGSLRWWYEVLIRGMGGWACDPSDKNADLRCKLDEEKFKERMKKSSPPPSPGSKDEAEMLAKSGLCPACQVFGTTGWAKTFKLQVVKESLELKRPFDLEKDEVFAEHEKGGASKSAYYFPPGLIGTASLTILPRRRKDMEIVRLLLGLLEFIRRNAALGAKTGLGYGLFEWKERPEDIPSAEEFASMVAERARVGRNGEKKRWPDLREMFFAEVQLEKRWEANDFVNFKYDLRAAFREGKTITKLIPDEKERERLRHFLLGTIKEDPNQASKIKMALLPDRRILRVWGWVPEDLAREAPKGINRQEVVTLIQDQIRQIAQGKEITHWREFNSSDDAAQQFLQSLMGA